MSIRVAESEWRQKCWERHGEAVYNDIKRNLTKSTFDVKEVAALPALEHLADRTAYDLATAVCRELEIRKKLKRQGVRMMLRRNPKRRKNAN